MQANMHVATVWQGPTGMRCATANVGSTGGATDALQMQALAMERKMAIKQVPPPASVPPGRTQNLTRNEAPSHSLGEKG